ncbi:2Fe-2S iron-sulfur cluster-binding protein [Rothia sp. ZJ932]|uniref:2Fe-2S iron-sulfur cluster-binding protein n=1 Tax=Rothia sp. ZJ932 TaxID=2810516 RepID=UPI0019688D65|nr:2Fe-2S iron-sulfur cluster-binding protein [Rothia sp. ZJ932]QRZ61353.1 2Fe-2S iron-sulfur cluster binding domain-containing protein [Rothia sp. ZJ932]
MSGIDITVVGEDGTSRPVEWEDHQNLLDALLANGFPVLATCGGNASCATCHVFIDPEHIDASGERTDAEADLLSMIDDVATEHSRLACQTEFVTEMAGATVTLKAGM